MLRLKKKCRFVDRIYYKVLVKEQAHQLNMLTDDSFPGLSVPSEIRT